ncbi:NAD(P)/FAD-dependent oxidoreductase [Alteribacillus bidgolensis]|uniref:Sarcosine oxidase subunit beta n=1 Tax=Alteribacillus bidgolensis TaxID=930129 RepID=A0A1G8HIB1_9BACI|nr:FAD-dependent oxidoreductase [Alteribacillus bidgolensis]SDI06406.1 sarcosine oxidase subunit beta [Alteribacillus bidgolensis]
MRKNCNALIIGGGIIGSAIAYYTAKAGHDVVLIEKGEFASGTSSKCDGNILAIDKDPGFDSQMSLVSQKLVHELKGELNGSFEYRNPGSILVCETDEEMEAAQKWVNQQEEAGLPFRMLDRADLREESEYFADDLPGGLECASDATVNPYLMTYALIDGAKLYGASFYSHTEVNNIEKEIGTNQYVVDTSKGAIRADKVINAGGVWAPLISKMLDEDIDIPIQPRKGHIIVAAREMPLGMRKVMEFGYLISKFGGERQVDAETEKYGVALVFEPTESQNFLIGSSREFNGFQTKVDFHVVKKIAHRAIRFYPKLKDMLIIRSYAGLRPWTPDHLPIVSEVKGYKGFYIAAGHEGDGISLAAVTGKLIQELIEEKEKTIVPVDKLSLHRFQKKEAAL